MAKKNVQIGLEFINNDMDNVIAQFKEFSKQIGKITPQLQKLTGKELDAMFKALNARMKELIGTRKNLNTIKKLSSELDKAETKYLEGLYAIEAKEIKNVKKLAKEKAKLTKVSVAYNKKMDIQKRRIEGLLRTNIKLKETIKKQKDELLALRPALKKSEAAVKKLRKQEELLAKIKMKNKEKAESFTALSTGVTAVINVLRTGYMAIIRFIQIGRRLTNWLISAITDFGDFTTTIRSASFILGTTQRTVAETAASVTFLGISMSDAAQGLDEFGRAGYGAADALQAFAPIAMFADAVNTNLGRATTMVTGAMKSFSFEAEDVWRITSGMTNAVYDSRNSFETLETAFSYAGAAGAAFNQSFEDVLASIMAFRDLGLKASTAGTVYRRALARLANATKPTRKAFQALGLDITKFTVQSGNSFNRVIKEFAKLRDNIEENDFSELMGKTIGPRFAAYMTKLVDAVNEGSVSLDATAQDLREKSDTLANLTLYNMTTIEQQIRIFRSLVEKAWLTFGASLSDTLLPFLSAFNVFTVQLLDKWKMTIGKMSKTLEEGVDKMSKDDMGKMFKDWEKSITDAIQGIIDWIVKYKDIIETTIFISEVLGKVIAIPFVLLANAVGVVIAWIYTLFATLSSGAGAVKKTILGLISAALSLTSYLVKLGTVGRWALGIHMDDKGVKETYSFLTGLNKKVKLLTGSWEDSINGGKKWLNSSSAIMSGLGKLDGMYAKLITSDASAIVADSLGKLTTKLKNLKKEVSGGMISKKLGDIMDAKAKYAEETAKADRYAEEADEINFDEKLRAKAFDTRIKNEVAANKAIKLLGEERQAEADRILNIDMEDKMRYENNLLAYQKEQNAKNEKEMFKFWDKRTRDYAKFMKKKEEIKKLEARINKIMADDEIKAGKAKNAEMKRLEKKRTASIKLEHKLRNEIILKGLLDMKTADDMTLRELQQFKQDYAAMSNIMSTGKDAYMAGRDMGDNGLDSRDRSFIDSIAADQEEYGTILESYLMQQDNFDTQMSLSFESLARSFGSSTEIMGTLAGDIANTTYQGMNNMFMAIFDKSKKIKDVFKDMGKSMLQSLVSAFTKMLLQTLIFGKLLAKTRGQAGMAQAKADSANAGIAAYRSGWEAGHGWMGLVLSEVFKDVAIAQTDGMMNTGAFSFFKGTGLDGVPGTYTGKDNTTVNASPGEIILDNEQSDVLRGGGLGGNGDTFNIKIDASDSKGQDYIDKLIETINGNSEVRRAMKTSLARQGA